MQAQATLPVIALTSSGELENRIAVARSGGCRFLQKPLPAYEILKAVTDQLRQARIEHHSRVLIVDDDDSVTEHLSELLRPLGLEATRLHQPQQFWQVLTATQPSLLLLDLEMPGFDGIELCQAVRGDPQWQQLPIVFLSSHTEASQLEQAFSAGADDYISKSTSEVELKTRILHRLQRAGIF
jgi:DNA-binding response OmpR family regulator